MKIRQVEPREGTSSPDFIFLCPGCQFGHGIWVTHPNDRTRAMWAWNGSMDRPTFTPSLLVEYGDGKRCHSFITDGRIQFLGDCTHALAGQTVDMVDD